MYAIRSYYASRLQSFLDPAVAAGAFFDQRQSFAPFVLGNPKGAGNHAEAAADAAVCLVNNRTFRSFLKGTDRTHRSAGRIVTVHAHLFVEGELVFPVFLIVTKFDPGIV